jgi:serine/threonine-protein kinase RsbW
MKILSKITLPAKMDSLRPFMESAAACAREQGFSQNRINDIELAVEEVLVNIFNYAYPEGGGDVEMICQLDAPGRLVLQVADRGIAFDMLAYDDPDTTAEIENRRIGGLGIFFVKQLMDDVRYRREHDRNVLTLTASEFQK